MAKQTSKDNLPLDQIYQGNCLTLLQSLPDDCIDLVVSSPPYNLGKEYEARMALEHYLEEQTVVLQECARVLKSTGSIFWQVGAFSDKGMLIPLDIRFFPIFESIGLIPRNRIMWVRQHGLHGRRKFSCRHETILWFTASDDYFLILTLLECHKNGKIKSIIKEKNAANFLAILTAKIQETFGLSET